MNEEKKGYFRTVGKIAELIETAKNPRVVDGVTYASGDINEEIIFKILEVALEKMGRESALKNFKIAEEILEFLKFSYGSEIKTLKAAEIYLTRYK